MTFFTKIKTDIKDSMIRQCSVYNKWIMLTKFLEGVHSMLRRHADHPFFV